MPSWTASFTMLIGSISPARACAEPVRSKIKKVDRTASPMPEIHQPARLATRAASFRYGGRHHPGIPGGISRYTRAASSESAGLVLPSCNNEAMALHLEEISLAVAPGAHAILLLDQAGWHVSKRLSIPDNITLLPLPPKSPELNPVENIWQFMRDNWLSNRVFKSYDDILDHCCFAWNKLIDMPWKIMSIGTRDWVYRS